jgi:hypothetical protein
MTSGGPVTVTSTFFGSVLACGGPITVTARRANLRWTSWRPMLTVTVALAGPRYWIRWPG